MDEGNITDRLLEIVLGLLAVIGALAAWVHVSHVKRVRGQFDKNDAAHEKLYDKLDETKDIAVETRAMTKHIIRYHDKMPEFKNPED